MKSMKALQRFLLLGSAVLTTQIHAADATWNYAVQISATVQSSPPRITLSWPQDDYGANNYTVFRKAKNDTDWGTGTLLPGTQTNFVDNSVSVGTNYEYQVVKASTVGYTAWGYIYAGINAPLTESRGKLVLIVATNSTVGLSSELARLQTDLTGDGWLVLRHDVSSNDTPGSVKNLITTDYYNDTANVKAVFLFGHVPVLLSGPNLNYDGHEVREMPADAYYGDMDGDWSSLPDYLPSNVDLMVGRVDLSNMPGVGAAVPWPNETELLRNYLNKDHNWRNKLINVANRALIADRRGVEPDGEVTSISGFGNFGPLVGPANVIKANTEDASPISERWISWITASNFVWAYGCGAGSPAGISHLGTNGLYNEVWSTDIVGDDVKGVFVMFFGSWFGEWENQDNFLRSVLATPTMGLASFMAGRPHWYLHHMGLGETIGYSTRLSMNNSTLYQTQSNDMTRAIYIALMGDPTLRMNPVGPPSALNQFVNNSGEVLSWSPSTDSVLGYHVYRATSPSGPFTRLTTAAVTGTTFTDTNVSAGSYTYMVRAEKLQTTPSGTYFDLSEGIFVNATVVRPFPLLASHATNSLILTWNSLPGASYHVQSKTSLAQPAWTNASGTLVASGTTSTWTETNINSAPQRFYRVSSP
jgi:hypothetical protein